LLPQNAWLNEDVTYIVSPEERAAFEHLQTAAERDRFIEQFWLSRNPTPDTLENPFKEEHYRRIAWANRHFASDIPGWKTDRGRLYIVFGPPDEIESHPTAERYQRPPEEGGGVTTAYPFEQWRYRHIEHVGDNVVVEFIDHGTFGEYPMSFIAQPNLQQGTSPRFPEPFQETLPKPIELKQTLAPAPLSTPPLPPVVRFKDLEAALDRTPARNTFPDAHAYFFPLTAASVLTNVALPLPNGSATIFGRIATPPRIVESFEAADPGSVYTLSIPLPPGDYRLDLAVKDATGKIAAYQMPLNVPSANTGSLMASSIVLADRSGMAQPRLTGVFRRSENLGVFFQVYNIVSARIEYQVVAPSGRPVLAATQEISGLPGAALSQSTVEKWLPLRNLRPGHYTLQLKIVDAGRNRALAPTAGFTVLCPAR